MQIFSERLSFEMSADWISILVPSRLKVGVDMIGSGLLRAGE